MSRSIGHARWFLHPNAVNPSSEMRQWLTDRASLTIKLTARSSHFRVQRLHQKRRLCLVDECKAVRLPRCVRVHEREVLLRCDERPVVFAHTIMPVTASASDWPFFGTLGERSLGTTLFGDPQVVRGALHFARLHAQHPLARRAYAASGMTDVDEPLYARRCLFQRGSGLLLVTEIFLPGLTKIRPASTMLATEILLPKTVATKALDETFSKIQAIQ